MKGKEKINNFLFPLFGFQKIKSNAHLVFIVCIHIAIWCLLLGLPLIIYPLRFDDSRFLYSELLSKILPIGLFYLNYYFLLPRFFEKRKYYGYFSIILAAIIVIAAQEVIIRNTMRGPGLAMMRTPPGINTEPTVPPTRMIGPPPFKEQTFFGVPVRIVSMSLNRAVSSCIILLLMSSLIRLAYSFLKNQNEKKALENAHLNAEINFLRSQINPHFLFNTLNSIYSQAHNKSEHTEYSILKLSDLLRYVLYDSTQEKVELDKDIHYLTNYVDLQRMRLSQKVTIGYEVTGITKGKQIVPLLLITFVENAFKHGISYTNPSAINIGIWIFEKTLTLHVTNPIIEANNFTNGGVGLKNVTRRLELLYPGKHWLDIVRNDSMHIVNLKINLDSD